MNPTSSQIDLSANPFQSEQEYTEIKFIGSLTQNHLARSVLIRECDFEKTDLSLAKLLKIKILNSHLSHATLTGADLSESYLDSTTFTSCRLTGTIFSEGKLEDCIIRDSAINLALFRFTGLKNVHFEGCNLQGADFYDARLKKVTFVNCNLEEADFTKASLDRVDLRSSNLLNIKGISNLRGAVISSAQLIPLAAQIAYEMGIIVNDL